MSRAKLLFGIVAAGAGLALLVAERKRPLRRQHRDALARNTRNVALGAGCAAFVSALETPMTQAIARRNAAGRRGLAHRLPRPLRLLGGVAAMDYGFYLWHIATHRVPFLWRWHRVHHVDPDMDASTAIRFHPIDMLISLPWRLVQVRLAGIDPAGLRWWSRFFTASILFHHSNLRLPEAWDRRLSYLLTTPRMHGVHHSQDRAERNANYTSGISLWDRLHGTYRMLPPESIAIGVGDPAAETDVPLAAALEAPLKPFPSAERRL